MILHTVTASKFVYQAAILPRTRISYAREGLLISVRAIEILSVMECLLE